MHNQAVNLTIHLKLQLDLIYNFHWRLCYYMLRIPNYHLHFKNLI